MTPLSQSQLGIFYACQDLEENSGNYQIPALYKLPTTTDLKRLKQALDVAIKAHPYILSRIVLDGDQVMMQSGDFSDNIVAIKEIKSIDDVRPSFCRTMDLLHDQLFRMEIYKTPEQNYLYIDVHHIILDLTAGVSLMTDIERAYNGIEPIGEEIDGGEIAQAEFELRGSDEWQKQREWYLKEFANAEEIDSMPIPTTINLTSDEQGLVETDFQITIKQTLVDTICQKYGIRESTVFTATWGKLLANYTAEDKAAFATIYHGRIDKRTRQAVTMMVHTMPVYMEMPTNKPIGEWLQSLANQQKETRNKNLYSFSDIHQDLNLRGDVLFAYQGRQLPTTIFGFNIGDTYVTSEDLRVARPGVTIDGQLFMTPSATSDSDFRLRISYQSALYSPEMVADMAEAYTTILTSMLDAETIGDLQASSSKQIQWLDNCNPEKILDIPRDKTVADLFNENVNKYPDNECCIFEDKRFTYKQIGEITDCLATMIQQKVTRKDDDLPVVSFIVPRNELMLIVPVAITKAGCTYQPLDSSYPKERLNFMIKDAEAQLLISTSEFREFVDEYTGISLIINTIKDIKADNVPEKVAVAPDNTFILLYTSGTTGTPKGVMLTQRNIMAFCTHHTKDLQMDSKSRLTAYASYGFDAYMMDLWAAMTSGAALHIISETIRYDLIALKDYIEKEHITHGFMTTQVGTQLAVNFPDIPSLKVLVVGGEKLVSIDPPKYRLINAYGPTEATVYVTSHEVDKNEKNIPIGRATGNSRLYVVNKDLQRVPMGAIGELWTSGTQTSKGYLHLPDKTAAAFVDNPFSKDNPDFAKAYRTGDIVRYREDGAIEFIGRKDGQVKIRGFRIELKEVEAVIRDFSGIQEVTVQAFDLEAGGKAIVAYIVSSEKIDIQELNNFICEQKPPYMVPAVTMQIDEIPLNVNGKVDKKRLPKPEIQIEDTSDDKTPAAPLNYLEEELMQLIGNLVNTTNFAITTPLAYVGLTSISSIKLATELYKRYGITISNKDLTKTATLQSIENLIIINLLSGEEKTQTEPKSEPKPKILSAPLSNAQLGVFYECMKNTESTVYNVPSIISFPNSVSAEQIKTAVEETLKLHPILHARFDNTVDPPMQITDNEPDIQVSISKANLEEQKKTFVQPFDLLHGPLYRAVVCGNTLLFDVHHLVMDGSSLSLFLHQVCDIIDNKDVTPETCTFFEYACEEQNADNSEAEAFFNEQLSSVDEATSLPADLHGNETDGKPAEVVQPVDHEAVERFAKERGLTPASVYLAAIEYITARYGNTKDVCICTVSSGRDNVKIADTIGMFVNTLTLVSHITDQTVDEYLRSVADNFSRTLEHEFYPFAKISNKFNINPELVFVYEVGVIDHFTIDNQSVTIQDLELSAPKFKVTILVEEKNGQISLVASYNTALYSENMMKRMLESLNQVIINMIKSPEAKITSVSILSEAQQKEVDSMHSVGTAPLPIRLFHAGMEKWAMQTPDKTAIIATDNTLTYKEFDKVANRIANALISKGLKKGNAVVVLLPRKSTTIACIFGIMKAGGAFIPCDPEYPTERINLIADDSGAPFVVTARDMVTKYGKRGLVIDDLLTETNDNQPDVKVSPDDLAYFIYTSGSTGRPKGVRVAHKNITTYITASPQHPMRVMMGECERMCSVSTISFDASICEYGMALFNGVTFVFSSEEESKDPIALTKLITRTKSDYFGCTSSRMLQYLELPEFEAYMPNFKCILQGGEKFSEILLDKLRKINKTCVILNGYGPTEISIGCNSVDLQHAEKLTVGKPIPNYTEWIIDKDNNELPVGVTGELCVGGEGVTQGYNNLPEKTAEKFITYGGMRAFKTGDYARWLPNGEVEILGRTDNQVKLRGLRIELGEVETAISQVEGVKNVLVKICNLQGRDHLSAYYVADREIDINSMKKAISHTLTAYMVPTAYLQMDKFPITPNGKVDFRHLPDPKLAQAGGDYVAAANSTEKFFADTFAQILDLDKVGATDSFFDLGGTSLVVMRVVIASQKAGYQITYADVFANPTPRLLSKLVSKNDTQNDPDADIKDFDYTNIDKLLKYNVIEEFAGTQPLNERPLGNVLLTGATGFLGIHIFRHLLEQYPDSKIYCLLRSKRGISAEERLRQMVFYYFENNFASEFGKRIFVIEGDVTAPIKLDAKINTVINCAAIVKHFAKGTEIEDVNVGGVRNCIDFCLKQNARLIQISTYSVGGASVNGEPAISAYTEQMLFLGQRIHNQYVHSKIMAERCLLDAVANKGLDGKIMRVGNLSARSEDGEFQINVKTNSFMGRLKIYQMLGVLPYSAYQSPIEFSPIDETSAAICLLAQTPSKCLVFHPYNSHHQLLGDVLYEMKSIGKTVNLVEDADFVEVLNKAKADESKQEQLSAMLAYENKPEKDFVQVIAPDNSYTMQVLLRLGFRWSPTSWDYIDQFLKQVDSLRFFD